MSKTKINKVEEKASEVKEEKKVKKVAVVKVRGKKYKEVKAKIDGLKLYKIDQAIELLKVSSNTKFDQTLELHIVVKKQGLSVNVNLPHSGGK